MPLFKNREEAGRQLVEPLRLFQAESSTLLAIPRGGILVAQPVIHRLKLPLSVVPIRPLALSWCPDSIGYVTHQGDLHLNEPLIGQLRVSRQEIHRLATTERSLLWKDLETWKVEPPSSLLQQRVIIVDDGMHSGWTMFSAVEAVRNLGAHKIIVAVPVSHFRAERFVSHHCDQVISLINEDQALFQIANYYEDFSAVSDQQISAVFRSAPQAARQTAGRVPSNV